MPFRPELNLKPVSFKTTIQFESLESVGFPNKPLRLAVGMFDGVHLGHQAVIETAVQSAHASNGVCGVLTFWPHPSRLFNPDDPVNMIMSPEIKADVLSTHNIEYIIQQPFDPTFAAIKAEHFVAYLKEHLPSLNSIHVGSNWRFGKGRIGDIPMLVRLGKEAGVHVINVERVYYDGEPISSTRIREHISVGEMEFANALLGDVYFSIGSVVEGKKLGAELGFPTLNLPWSPDLKPPRGVYCVEVEGLIGGSPVSAKGVANFGIRPTIGESDETVLELHLLEVCPFTTDHLLKVRWYHFIRPEKKFENLEALKKQISLDVEIARNYWKC